MAEFGVNDEGSLASRRSVGLELLNNFFTKTRTFASVNFQGRLVRRDGFFGDLRYDNYYL